MPTSLLEALKHLCVSGSLSMNISLLCLSADNLLPNLPLRHLSESLDMSNLFCGVCRCEGLSFLSASLAQRLTEITVLEERILFVVTADNVAEAFLEELVVQRKIVHHQFC